MITLRNTACIEAPTNKVWSALADLESVDAWVEPIKRARCDGDKSQGVGASRTCDLAGGISIREHWTSWNDGQSFEYTAVGMPLIERATNRWTLHSEDDKTLVVSETEIVLKGGMFGRILEPFMRLPMKALGPRTLASLKYWVENGTRYPGKHSKLRSAPVTC